MNAPTHFHGEPEILAIFRALPDTAKHQFLQLAIDEMELDGTAERTADAFLGDLAWAIEDGDEDRADDLYPHGCTHRDTWLKHKAACLKSVLHYERQVVGRVGMLAPVVRLSDHSVIA